MRLGLKRHIGSAFTILMVLILAGVLYTARDFGSQARFFPWAIGFPALALALVQLTVETVRVRRGTASAADEGIVDLGVDRDIPMRDVARRGGELAAWIVGYFVGIVIVGFIIASPVFVLAYLVVRAKSRPLVIVTCLILVMALHLGVFDQVLHVTWLEPLFPAPQTFVLELFG